MIKDALYNETITGDLTFEEGRIWGKCHFIIIP